MRTVKNCTVSMIIIFCGVPGSGKSTVAERLVEKFLKEDKSCELFVSDEVSEQVYDTLFDFLQEKIGEVDCLVIDATFYKKKWRDKVKEIAEENDEDLLSVYLHCGLETCIQRNEERPPEEQVREKAIHIINSEMEEPESPDLEADTQEFNPKEITDKILEELEKQN